MKMRLSVFLILSGTLLSGCHVLKNYHPNLAEQPTDPAKYEADRQACIRDVERRVDVANKAHAGDNGLIGAFGLAGAGIVYSREDKQDDYYKDFRVMHDECMTARGYKLK